VQLIDVPSLITPTEAPPKLIAEYVRRLNTGCCAWVNTISPGPIDTPLYGKLGMSQEGGSQLAKLIPAGRFGDPGEIAKAVVFFASDECGFSVGSELLITGGMANL
jgi:NAD(P)-dependent dehydrogenase (short-subunit alcohol dehydrogenase family)